MPTFLFHEKSGDFFVYTSVLAKRKDMRVVDAESLEAAKQEVADDNADKGVKKAKSDELKADAAAEKAAKAAAAAEAKRKDAEAKAAKVAADKAAKLAAKGKPATPATPAAGNKDLFE